MHGVEGQRAYYRAALETLRFVESRRNTRRRFGAEADALWSSFKGDLGTSARIDLMLRDADAEWPGAFGARSVYAIGAVAEDEPFGASWEPLDDVDAEELWRGLAAERVPDTVTTAIEAIASAWGLSLADVDVPPVGPTDSYIVAGPSAVAALIAGFAAGQDLDWSKQVTVIATPPGHRHLAAAGAALVNAAGATVLLTSTDEPAERPHGQSVISDDAAPEDRERAQMLAQG